MRAAGRATLSSWRNERRKCDVRLHLWPVLRLQGVRLRLLVLGSSKVSA